LEKFRQIRDRSRCDILILAPALVILGPTAHHTHLLAQPESIDEHLQESDSALEWLEQGDLEISPRQGKDQTWKTRATADIDEAGTLSKKVCREATVEDMTFPDPVCFSRPYCPALNPEGG